MNRQRKIFIVWLLLAGMFTTLFPTGNEVPVLAAKKAHVKSIKITNTKKKLTLEKGHRFTLKVKVKVTPNKKKYQKVTFTSSNKKVATVSKKGIIKAKKAGTATIRVISKTNKKKKTSLKVVVKNATPTNTAEPDTTPTSAPTGTPAPTSTPVPPIESIELSRKPFSGIAYVGNTLADVSIEGGSILDNNGNTVNGTYSWDNPDTRLEASGKSRHELTFTPNDSSLKAIKGISILVQTDKKPITLSLPKATAIYTGKALSTSALTGGSATDADGNKVAGSFQWTNKDTILLENGLIPCSVTFVPDDSTTYRSATAYVNLTVKGTAITSGNGNKKLNISDKTWKNETGYGRAWSGNSYCLNSYVEGIDLSKYSDITVTAKQYNSSGVEITSNKSNIAFKLSASDWGTDFAQMWATDTGKLSLDNYTGGDLYLIVQNPSATIDYIEITSITLTAPGNSNITDGSTLKDIYGCYFDKVGVAIEKNQINSKNILNFATSQYNSLTMGNEMKPDYILGWAPDLSSQNPSGYVDTSKFTYEYKDSKYPKINLDSIGDYVKKAYDSNMKLRYHVFIWHAQSPRWFFKENYSTSSSAKFVSPEVMSGRLEYLIRNVMTYIYNLQDENGTYIGREVVDSWDIANEYLNNNNGDEKSYWDEVYYPDYTFNKNKHSGILTPTYIKQGFAIAYSILKDYKLEDSVNLLYNDFNTYMAADKIVTMINYFNTKDEINPNGEVICSGVGMQMHLDRGYPSVSGVRDSALSVFRKAGFVIEITEFDLTDYTKSETTQFNQMQKWYDLMKVILEEKDKGAKITGITWWGPSDNTSWRANGVPLLFSDYWTAKEHYYYVIQAASDYNEGM